MIRTERGMYSIDDFGPKEFSSVGEMVAFPVAVRAFSSKGGGVRYGLNVDKGDAWGEAF